MTNETRDLLSTVIEMSARARLTYGNTARWTSHKEAGSCMTQHVPVALLNRIRDLSATLPPADKPDPLVRLAERVAALNRDAGEIGAGMLASLVDDARAALGRKEGQS